MAKKKTDDENAPKLSLKERIKKASTIATAGMLSESRVYEKKDSITTSVPMINVALSGQVDGGMTPGLLQICGKSKHFKSCFSLLIASAFMKKNPDGMILFYDSEWGSPKSYFESFNLDPNQVHHAPIKNIEQLTFDVVAQLESFNPTDKVLVLVDSIGNLASKREIENALKKNEAQDMTRAKALKSLFRMVTPYLEENGIPMVVINHVYEAQDNTKKQVVSGGTGVYLSSNNIWIIGRRQDATKNDGEKEVLGYDFIINVEKSRNIREGMKIPISVSYADGIKQWSGLVEEAMDAGWIVCPKQGWYVKSDPTTGEVLSPKNYRLAEIEDDADFWKDMFKTTNLAEFIKNKYTLPAGLMDHVADTDLDLMETVDA